MSKPREKPGYVPTLAAPKRNLAYKGLQWFHDTPKTESAFYIRFQTLPKEYEDALSRTYHCKTQMQVFFRICKWWAVKCA